MRKELNDLELTKVSGGGAYINTRRKLLVFDSFDDVFHIKGSPYEAQELMDSLIGKYTTTLEFDTACVELLRSKGFID